jgi:WD40 repeat protein
VLTGSRDNTARLWDAATGQEIRASRGHEDTVTSVAFSPDGARVLTGSGDRTARLWDAATGKEIRAFKGNEDTVSSVAFSPDGARVLTGSKDKTARLWDAAIPKGSIFDIACAWLPGHDLSGLGEDYGLDLSPEAPICQKDASGKFTTPMTRNEGQNSRVDQTRIPR